MRSVITIAVWICLGASPLGAAAGEYPANQPGGARIGQLSPVAETARPMGNWPSPNEVPAYRPGGVVPAAFESPVEEPQRVDSTGSQPLSPAAETTATRRDDSLPLLPPESDAQPDGVGSGGYRGGAGSAVTVIGSLAIVLGLFLLLAWVLRRASPASMMNLPSEVVEVLGQLQLPGRQQVQLLRCGTKLLLVSVTPAGAETLTEITDPDEVNRLAGLCQQARPGSSTATFRQVFGQLAREGSVLGLLGGARNQADDYREDRHA